jgi:CheY-like chemotaxis protein
MTATDEKKLVLIVDDAPANLQMMRSILKRRLQNPGCY